MRTTLLLVCVLAAACSDDDVGEEDAGRLDGSSADGGDRDAGRDASPEDAALDATESDSEVDAEALDAETLDAEALDAETLDAEALDAEIDSGLDATAPDSGSDAGPDASVDAGSDTGDDATTPPDDAGTPPDNECEQVGGLCVGSTTPCEVAGGAIDTAGNAGCVFSDGLGLCCVPPEPMSSGDTCASHGGVCAPIAGCNFAHGAFAPPSCGGVGVVCCVPSSVCGEEDSECCNDSRTTSFRPVCDRGSFVCSHIEGTFLVPEGTCLVE